MSARGHLQRWPFFFARTAKERFVKKVAVTVLSILALSGCSNRLAVTKVEPEKVNDGPVYHLPKVRYDITVSYTLKSCNPTPQFDVTAKAAEVYIPDPVHWYQVDYESLRSGTKTTNLEIDLYPNGTLKTINASAEDKTAKIAVAIGKAMAQLALPGIGPSGLLETECKPAVTAAITKVMETTKTITEIEEGTRGATPEERQESLNSLKEHLARLVLKRTEGPDYENTIYKLQE